MAAIEHRAPVASSETPPQAEKPAFLTGDVWQIPALQYEAPVGEPTPTVPQGSPRSEQEPDYSSHLKSKEGTTRYWVEQKPFAQGGMCSIHRGWDAQRGMPVAIKQPHLESDETDAMHVYEGLRLEAIVMGRVEHPGVLPIYEFYPEHVSPTGKPFLVMPLLDAEKSPSLDGWRKQHPDPTKEEISQSVVQLADTIDFLDQRGVHHRDLKLQNAFLWKGQVVLADFGVSNWVIEPRVGYDLSLGHVPAERLVTSHGPEVFTSELYSFAIMTYELLTGQVFYSGSDSVNTLSMGLRYLEFLYRRGRDPQDPQLTRVAERFQVSASELEAVFARAFHLDPTQRYQTAKEFARALTQVLGTWEEHMYLLQKERTPGAAKAQTPESVPEKETRPEGKTTVYVCAQGQERSVAAAEFEQHAGHPETRYLAGGFYSFGENIKSSVRTQVRAQMGFFHRQPSDDETKQMNQRVDEQAMPRLKIELRKKLQKLVPGNPTDTTFLRIFYDEESAMADEFIRVVQALGVAYELVSSPQIVQEMKQAQKEGVYSGPPAGHNWFSLLD